MNSIKNIVMWPLMLNWSSKDWSWMLLLMSSKNFRLLWYEIFLQLLISSYLQDFVDPLIPDSRKNEQNQQCKKSRWIDKLHLESLQIGIRIGFKLSDQKIHGGIQWTLRRRIDMSLWSSKILPYYSFITHILIIPKISRERVSPWKTSI